MKPPIVFAPIDIDAAFAGTVERLMPGSHARAQKSERARQIGGSVENDPSFVMSEWGGYSRHSVVGLFRAACLITGINPDHVSVRGGRAWAGEVAGYASGSAREALSLLTRTYDLALNHIKTKRLSADGEEHHISLMDFGLWAHSCEISLPKGFPSKAIDGLPSDSRRSVKKLSSDQEADIARRSKLGEPVAALAREFSVSRPTISKALKAKSLVPEQLQNSLSPRNVKGKK